jgi:hypothetical protein
MSVTQSLLGPVGGCSHHNVFMLSAERGDVRRSRLDQSDV